VEGAEYNVLKGAKNTLLKSRPVVLFEFGLGASNYYHVTPEQIFQFFDEEVDYHISLIDRYLKNRSHLSPSEFHEQYYQRLNYYFIAYPNEETKQMSHE